MCDLFEGIVPPDPPRSGEIKEGHHETVRCMRINLTFRGAL
jgi:hypothetical protein